MRDVPANFSVAKQSGTVWCSPMIEMELFFRVNSAPLSPPENLFFFASSVVLLSYLLKFTKTRVKEKALKPFGYSVLGSNKQPLPGVVKATIQGRNRLKDRFVFQAVPFW